MTDRDKHAEDLQDESQLPSLGIDKDIPIPALTKNSPERLALARLRVGESVLIKNLLHRKVGAMARRSLGKGNYTVRKVDGGSRVWRIHGIPKFSSMQSMQEIRDIK